MWAWLRKLLGLDKSRERRIEGVGRKPETPRPVAPMNARITARPPARQRVPQTARPDDAGDLLLRGHYHGPWSHVDSYFSGGGGSCSSSSSSSSGSSCSE